MTARFASMGRSAALLRALVIAVLLAIGGAWFAAPASAHGMESPRPHVSGTAAKTRAGNPEQAAAVRGASDDCVSADARGEPCPCCPPGGLNHCHHGVPLMFAGAWAGHGPAFGGTVAHATPPPGGLAFLLQSGPTRPPAT